MPDFEQPARDLAVCFGWDGDTRGVDAADQLAPVGGPVSFSFAADRARCFLVQIANGDEFRRAFSGEIGVDARMLASETANSDDCCA